MQMGTAEFNDFLERFMQKREKQGINSAFTANTMVINESTWGQPYFLSEEIPSHSHHPANARAGDPEGNGACYYAGTVKFEIKYDNNKRIIALRYYESWIWAL